MITKGLRILIADDQHFFRLSLERMLNRLGYFRILPLHRIDEVLKVVDYGSLPFDLVIINGAMAKDLRLIALPLCVDNPQIRNAMIYNVSKGNSLRVPSDHQQKVRICACSLPSIETISELMVKIEINASIAKGHLSSTRQQVATLLHAVTRNELFRTR